MNKVINEEDRANYSRFQIKELIGDHVYEGKTAFIGHCCEGNEDGLHLITYSNIVKAKDPHKTWSLGDAVVYVLRFVDVEIKVKEFE